MLAARRSFAGVLPLQSMPRLCEALEQPDGDCQYELAFDRGTLDVPHIAIRARAQLPLLCQRSLKRFLLPVEVTQKLALVADEDQEAALPEGYEALVVDAEGTIHPAQLIEDELILALPVVAVDPATEPVALSWPASGREVAAAEETAARANPFAVLAELKNKKQPHRP